MKIEDILQKYRNKLNYLKQDIIKDEFHKNNDYEDVEITSEDFTKNDEDVFAEVQGKRVLYFRRKYPKIDFTEDQLNELVMLHKEINSLDTETENEIQFTKLDRIWVNIGWISIIIHVFAAITTITFDQIGFTFAVIISGLITSMLLFSMAEILRLLAIIANKKN